MPLNTKENAGGKVLELQMSGKLAKEDYAGLATETERLIHQHGRINLLVLFDDFHGWTPGGFWEDASFSAKHSDKIGRIAFVGDTKWQQAVAALAKPFTSATVRYFELTAVNEARAWVGAAI